jgi:hypothetical protein
MRGLVDAVFVLLVIALAAAVVTRLSARGRALLIAWLVGLGMLAGAGVFLRDGRVQPYFLAAGVLPTIVAIAFVTSRAGAPVLARTSPATLVGLQSFRIVVELVLWALAVQGRLSPLLTFEGRNYDVLVGLTALPMAWLCFARRAWPPAAAAVWNVAGIVILVSTVLHFVLSAPAPFQRIHTAPPTTIVATLPYIWLPGFLVPLAWTLHVASLRTLGGRPPSPKEMP